LQRKRREIDHERRQKRRRAGHEPR